MRPVAAARGAGPEILVEPSVFREVRPALVDWQALKNPFQKNPVFFMFHEVTSKKNTLESEQFEVYQDHCLPTSINLESLIGENFLFFLFF